MLRLLLSNCHTIFRYLGAGTYRSELGTNDYLAVHMYYVRDEIDPLLQD